MVNLKDGMSILRKAHRGAQNVGFDDKKRVQIVIYMLVSHKILSTILSRRAMCYLKKNWTNTENTENYVEY